MTETVKYLIDTYGDQAYWMATKLAVAGSLIGDKQGAKDFADAAIELMQLGYHKHPEKKLGEKPCQSV